MKYQAYLLTILLLILSFTSKALPREKETKSVDPAQIYSHVHPTFLKSDHQDLKNALKSKVISPSKWQSNFNQSNLDFLCVGESHDQDYREKLMSTIFNQLVFDHLLLETTPKKLDTILDTFQQTGEVTFLGAPFAPLLGVILETNKNVRFSGVEKTSKQNLIALNETLKLSRGKLSREAFIAQNIVDQINLEEKTVALYGALHCANINMGLGLDTPFFRLMKKYFSINNVKATNIRIIKAKDFRVLSALLRQYDYLQDRPIVLSNLDSLDPAFYNYKEEILTLFQAYNNILIIP